MLECEFIEPNDLSISVEGKAVELQFLLSEDKEYYSFDP